MKKIYFLYSKNVGSINMRCFQIFEVFSKLYKSNMMSIDDPNIYQIRNSIIFFFKFIKDIKILNLSLIKKKENYLVFDTIDIRMKDIKTKNKTDNFSNIFNSNHFIYFDYIITPIKYIYDKCYNNPKIIYIPHHYDIFLKKIQENPDKIDRILYNGSLMYIGKIMNELINVEICIDFNKFKTQIDYYSRFKYHLSFYDDSRVNSELKPITKIATASACGAIIICENTTENIYWLGDDYPFYINLNDKRNSLRNLIRMINENQVDEEKIRKASSKMLELKNRLNIYSIMSDYYLEFIINLLKLNEKKYLKTKEKFNKRLKKISSK